MYRTYCVFIALLLAVAPVTADEGKKLTNTELKEMTSNGMFYAGYSQSIGVRWIISLFPNGTRELYWTNGGRSEVRQEKWRIDGDRICSQHGSALERCAEWRKSGERIDIWIDNKKTGYLYVLK